MSKKSFQIVYKVDAEKTEQIIVLIFELRANTGMEPESMVLPDGRVIPWYEYAAHQFAAEGRITEDEFIEWSMTHK